MWTRNYTAIYMSILYDPKHCEKKQRWFKEDLLQLKVKMTTDCKFVAKKEPMLCYK